MSIYNGNCLELLRMLPDNSVDSIVTDPPYGLSFMGKKWDYDVPSVEIWAECLRVLKPGGHMLAFAGTRTQHRMAVRIEDAGFEIRDMIAWVYGSGFPKSLDVSKAIDKAAGAEREVISERPAYGIGGAGCLGGHAEGATAKTLGDPVTPAAQQWQGWGTALKPALEPISVARKPLTGTVADNVLRYGTGAINIDGCRVETDDRLSAGSGGLLSNVRDNKEYPQDNGFEQSPLGRWPANLIHDGSDEVLAAFPNAKGQQGALSGAEPSDKTSNTYGEYQTRAASTPRNDSGSAARFFYCPKASKADRNYGCSELPDTSAADMTDREPDSDGMNSPRAGAGRTSGAKNNHPTVKPIALMRYLCRLVTPPNGVVLDPFTGSGSTGVAATLEGFNFLGAEMDPNFHTIASARLQQARTDSGAPTVITLMEYTRDSKPTGRLCKVPDITREQLADLLPLYGFTGKLDVHTGIMDGYNADRWCFVYRADMHGGNPVQLEEIIAP